MERVLFLRVPNHVRVEAMATLIPFESKRWAAGGVTRIHRWIVRPATLGALISLVLVFMFVNPGPFIAVGTTSPHWNEVPMPALLESHRAVAVQVGGSEFLYVIGGKASGTSISNKVYFAQLNPDGSLDGWTPTLSIYHRSGLQEHGAVAVGGRIYVLGGRGNSWDTFSSVYCAKPDALGRISDWTPVASMPTGFTLHAAVAVDNVIFVMGGYSSQRKGFVREVWAADITGGGCSGLYWRPHPEESLPRALAALSAVAVRLDNGRKFVYVMGGYDGSAYKQVWRAEVDSSGKLEPWGSLGDLSQAPTGLFRHVSAISGRYLYVIGGTTTGYDCLDTVYRARIKDDGTLETWFTLDRFPVAVFNHAATVSAPGRIYILGGNAGSGILDRGYYTPLLAFEKSASPPGSVAYGDTINYTLKLTNLDVRDFENLVITDTVQASAPAALAFHDLPGECHVYSGIGSIITATCTIPNLALGDTRALDFKVTIAQPVSALLSTSNPLQDSFDERAAEADALTAHSLPSTEVSGSSIVNQRDQDGVSSVLTPDCDADLCIEKADNPDPVMPGETLTYTLTITNEGPADAQDVSVLDYLPPDFEVVATTPVTISGPNPLEWRLPNMSAGQSEEIQVVGTVDPDSTDVILNVAMVLSDIDSSLANNVSEEWTAIGSLADLSIAKTDDPDPVNAGEMLTYTLWITNRGPSIATNVIVTDTLSGVVCNLDCLPPHCHLSPLVHDPGMVVCDLGAMPAGECEGIRIRAMAYPSSTVALTNTAEVRSDVPDSTPRNNKVQERTTINTLADLSVEKSDNVKKVTAGDVLVYTLRVNNDGPSYAHTIEVSDILPTGVGFRSSVPTVTSGPDPLVWYTDTLTVGEAWTIEITVAVNSSVVGLLTNTACVISDDDPDPHPLNNCDQEETLTPVPVTNRARVCEDGLWCKETEFFNYPYNVYLPIVLKSSV